MVCDMSSQGTFSAGLGAHGFENKMWEGHAYKKMFAKSIMEDAVTALKLNKNWREESPTEEGLALLRERERESVWQSAPGRHNGPKGDEGWKRGRVVGAVEESRPPSLHERETAGMLL